MSIICLLALMDLSLEMIPSPVQGASSSTLSKWLKWEIILRPSQLVTMQLEHPILCRLNCRARSRSFFTSFAYTIPLFFISWQMQVVLPPGAAAMSSTFSPGCGASAITGSKEDALWIMYWPDKYYGVAPIGTFDQQILIPTLDHQASGSSWTPLAMRAWASSFRLVLRELVRMVRGRGVSLASRNCSSSKGLRKVEKCSISSWLQPQQMQNRFLSQSKYQALDFLPKVLKFNRVFSSYFICIRTLYMSCRSTFPSYSSYIWAYSSYPPSAQSLSCQSGQGSGSWSQ